MNFNFSVICLIFCFSSWSSEEICLKFKAWIKDNPQTLTGARVRGKGISLESPQKFSQKIISSKLEKLMIQGFSHSNARDADKLCQTLKRIASLDKNRSYYIDASYRDVRGYHYLQNHPIDESPETRLALLRLCLNEEYDLDLCKKGLEKTQNLQSFYNQYKSRGKKNWDSFFKIPKGHELKDASSNGRTLKVNFQRPKDERFAQFLKNSVEKEWPVEIHFQDMATAGLDFKSQTVPHVTGSRLIVDPDMNLSEFESEWIFKHEFGHVLGLPDCYHEFYDTQEEVYVNYQLDTTDLMCSRSGDMTDRIRKELSRVYGLIY